MGARTVKITFEGDPVAIESFMSWLSNSGEQEYWMAMESAEENAREDGEDFAYISSFDYWNGNVMNCEVGTSLDD